MTSSVKLTILLVEVTLIMEVSLRKVYICEGEKRYLKKRMRAEMKGIRIFFLHRVRKPLNYF